MTQENNMENLDENVFDTVSSWSEFNWFGDYYDESYDEYNSIETVYESTKQDLDELKNEVEASYWIYSQDLIQKIMTNDRIDLLWDYKNSLEEWDQRTLEYFVDRYYQDENQDVDQDVVLMKNQRKFDDQWKVKHWKREKVKVPFEDSFNWNPYWMTV